MLRIYFFLLVLVCSKSDNLLANGIEVSNVRLVNRDTVNNTIWILADISWENAWHLSSSDEPGNYDAAWVFVKVSGGDVTSGHLKIFSEDMIIPESAHVEVSPDHTGFFVSLADTTYGDAIFNDVAILWNYQSYGFADTDEITVKVFAIEMVYIPEGMFVAGNYAGGEEVDPFIPTTISTKLSTTSPTGSDGIDGTASGGYPEGEVAPLNNNFPNGFRSFFCMKYELSQQQYADFLNDLTTTQAGERFQPVETFEKLPYRYDIYIDSLTGRYTSANPYLPINVLSYADGAAYADWAGLRPMTELEFEKVCRGPESAFPNQYPWGDTTVVNSDYTIINAGSVDELVTISDYTSGNAMYKAVEGDINGPVRCGVFAASSLMSTRRAAGASYYGVMEMGGNVLERVITIELYDGRVFKGTHGDGYLSETGGHTNGDWPSASSPNGASGRGGKWNVEKNRMLISDRMLVASHLGSRYHNAGFRFVRTSYE